MDEIFIKIDMMFWEKYVGIMHEKKKSPSTNLSLTHSGGFHNFHLDAGKSFQIKDYFFLS